jgi:hypothetical protein
VAQKRTWREKIKNNSDDELVAASMGYFIGIDGKGHWGIELVDEHLPLLAVEVAEDAEVLPQAQDELQEQRPSQDDAAPRDDTIPQVQTIQQAPGPSQDEDSPQTQAGGALSGERPIIEDTTGIPLPEGSDVSSMDEENVLGISEHVHMLRHQVPSQDQ